MPISGPYVHRQLLAAYAHAQARLEAARGEINQARQERTELNDFRGDAILQLAEHYLPELSRPAVESTWNDIQSEISHVLLLKEEHVRRLTDELQQVNAQRASVDAELLELNEQLDVATETQQRVAGEVEQALQQDQRFVELSDRAALAEAALERAEANLREIEHDSSSKLPAYDGSSLFRYLYDRGYGSQRYTSQGLTRRIDRWLSRYIGYPQARQSYEFLKQTPLQMRKIIADDRSALDTVLDELERRRDEVAERLGFPERLEAVRRLTEQRDQMVQQLESTAASIQSLQSQLNELEQTRGPYYRKAIDLFRKKLQEIDLQELKRRAASTREITDDQLVARLFGIETQIDQLDESTRERRESLDDLQSHLEGLGRLIHQFRAARYDSANALFHEQFDVNEELARTPGPSDLDELWMRMRRAHRWGPTAIDQVGQMATHPMTQILMNAMVHAAAGALTQQARNAAHRRSSGGMRSSGGRQRSSGGRRGGGGFHNRGSF